MKKRETGGRAAGPAFSMFMKNYHALHPEFQRVFKKPEGVYERESEGEKFYYTKISPPPKEDVKNISEKKIMF